MYLFYGSLTYTYFSSWGTFKTFLMHAYLINLQLFFFFNVNILDLQYLQLPISIALAESVLKCFSS